MALPNAFRFIHYLWRKPTSERLFAPRLKRFYRSTSFFILFSVITSLLSFNFFMPETAAVWRLRLVELCAPFLAPLHQANVWISQTVPSTLARLWTSLYEDPPSLKERDTPAALYELNFLRQENAQLRALLNLPSPAATLPPLTAETFCLTLDGLCNTLVLRAGTAQGVSPNMQVTNEHGLVGRVQTVTPRNARVLTVADPNLRVPIIVGSQAIHGIATGDGPRTMRILYFERPADVNVGDAVVTSGQGGLFSPGIPVGTILQITPFIKIQLAVNLRHVRFVHLLEPNIPPRDEEGED